MNAQDFRLRIYRGSRFGSARFGAFVMAVVACIVVSFATGEGLRPVLLPCLFFGAWMGFVWLPDGGRDARPTHRNERRSPRPSCPRLPSCLSRHPIVGSDETSPHRHPRLGALRRGRHSGARW